MFVLSFGHGTLLPPGVKMMHRAVAVADRELVGGGDRGGDVVLGGAHRVGQVEPLARPAAIADDSVQPVPWVLRVAMRGAAKRAIGVARRPADRRSPGRSPWPPLISTALRAEREQPLRLRAHLGFVCASGASSSAAASGRFGVITSARGIRDRARARRSRRARAAGRRRSRPSPDRAPCSSALWRSSPAATASMAADCDSMPIFTAPTSRSENTASICAAMKSRRHVVDAGDAAGVLRGQRGDDRRAIDAERRKCLEVGLDAGAAARIRAGDGDGDRGHHRAPSLRRTRAIDDDAQRARGACGSWRERQRRDHRRRRPRRPRSPARRCRRRCRRCRTSANPVCARCSASMMSRKPASADRRFRLSFEVVP